VGFRPMRWLRTNRRPWAWVALVALALQIGLAFGHLHVAPAAASTLSATASPQSDTGDAGDGDYCATCAILALLTGAQTATAPAVTLSIALVSTEIRLQPEAAHFLSPHTAFRSRAPPLS
jgi:hypothetical protein